MIAVEDVCYTCLIDVGDRLSYVGATLGFAWLGSNAHGFLFQLSWAKLIDSTQSLTRRIRGMFV